MKKVKVIVIIVVAVVLMGAAAVCLWHKGILYIPKSVEPTLAYEGVKPYTKPIGTSNQAYSTLLYDVQAVQKKAAIANGIEPQQDDSNIRQLVAENKLVKVTYCNYMNVVATYPYLTPNAYDLLLEIGRRYQEKLGAKSRLKVTSCLRTHDYIAELMKKNGNATRYSCHLHGTTFDISYLGMTEKKKECLARVLKELCDAGYLYAIHEVGQKCFHITLRKPGQPKSMEA